MYKCKVCGKETKSGKGVEVMVGAYADFVYRTYMPQGFSGITEEELDLYRKCGRTERLCMPCAKWANNMYVYLSNRNYFKTTKRGYY